MCITEEPMVMEGGTGHEAKRMRVVWRLAALSAAALAFASMPAWASEESEGQPDAAEIGKKLSNPTSNVWALFTEFDLQFSDGDANENDPKISGAMIFQPILPVPLHGEKEDAWNMLVRPTIPLVLAAPIPTGGR